MEITDYSQIAGEVVRRASKHVWCNFATVDRAGRPRSRVIHPVWEGPVGWIGTFPGSHKYKHLARTPFASCGYIDAEEPLYIDCRVTPVDDLATKQHAWDFIKAQSPEPYGFDPATIWADGPGGASFGLLRLDAWRVQLTTARAGKAPETTVWRPA
jgi:hypothetical protein